MHPTEKNKPSFIEPNLLGHHKSNVPAKDKVKGAGIGKISATPAESSKPVKAKTVEQPLKPTTQKVVSVVGVGEPKLDAEQRALASSVKALGISSNIRPLIPISQGDTASDVYVTHFDKTSGVKDVIFKPSEHAAVKNQIVSEVARLVGMEDVVPASTIGKATVLVPDLDYQVFSQRLLKGKSIQILVAGEAADRAIPIEHLQLKGEKFFGTVQGNKYQFILQDDDTYKAVQIENEDETALSLESSDYSLDILDEEQDEDEMEMQLDPEEPYLLVFKNGQPFLIEDEAQVLQLHVENKKMWVDYNNQRYDVERASGKVQIIGREVTGVVQNKVDHTFTNSGVSRAPLNILNPSKEREAFYNRVDMPHFITAFLAMTLFRHSDGKVTDLSDSNVLFQAIPNKAGVCDPKDPSCMLRPVLIDLDETMPEVNGVLIKDGKEEVHAVRNGLMGFPQAHKRLNDSERTLFEEQINKIATQREVIKKKLESYIGEETGFTDESVKACMEVIDKMSQFDFANKNYSLATFFFHVFPDYAEQWNSLSVLSNEDKAMHVGYTAPEDFEEILERYAS